MQRAADGEIAVRVNDFEWTSEGKRKGLLTKYVRRSRSFVNKIGIFRMHKADASASSRVAPQEFVSCPGIYLGQEYFFICPRFAAPNGKVQIYWEERQLYVRAKDSLQNISFGGRNTARVVQSARRYEKETRASDRPVNDATGNP